MKKHRIIRYILIPLIFLAVSFGTINKGWAAEEGGQVQTKAGIVLKKSAPTTEQTSDATHNGLSPQEKKPAGRLPNTGDLIKVSLLFTGVILSLLALILFFWKKRRPVKGERD
ncbi:LPXTG cell wall anchor domain-containing protein [Enterococcus rotai]|uniref:LPXTG cell wall anchor domain-containing protein n=1 Tax=Enterococcus rotai TaxID=118060 RepID=UPI0035C78013